MELKSMHGSIPVSRDTVIRLLQACAPRRLDSKATLVDLGKEEQKKEFAELLQKEFKLDLGLNPAAQLIKELRK